MVRIVIWVPGHVGINGNSADSAAKAALDGDVSDECIPFSDLKPHLNSYITELLQFEWDDYPLNKLHKINKNKNKQKTPPPTKNNKKQTSKKPEFLTSCRSNKREDTVLSGLHIG